MFPLTGYRNAAGGRGGLVETSRVAPRFLPYRSRARRPSIDAMERAFNAFDAAVRTDAGLPLRVLIIDDQPAVREGLARLIGATPSGLREVHTASNATEALRLLLHTRAQVVVLDVDLAGADGLELLPTLLLHARVVVLTSHGDPATRSRALRLGAEAFVEKTEPASVLLAQVARLALPRAGRDKAPMPVG